jgi:hypothetical protein
MHMQVEKEADGSPALAGHFSFRPAPDLPLAAAPTSLTHYTNTVAKLVITAWQ